MVFGFWVLGTRLGVLGFGFRVWGSGFKVSGFVSFKVSGIKPGRGGEACGGIWPQARRATARSTSAIYDHMHEIYDHTREIYDHIRKVDIRLPGKGDSNSRGARPVY